MALETICTPALIYLVFSIVQIIVDTGKGLYNTAFLKLIVTFIFTIFLNYLCDRGLGVVSWIIVFVPFILMSIIISVLLLMLGLDPTTGKLKVNGAEISKPAEDPRKAAKIPIYPIVTSEPEEKQTGTSLLKHLEEALNTVDNTPYPPANPSPYPPANPSPYPPSSPYPPAKPSSPYPPTKPSSPYPPTKPSPNTSPYPPPMPTTYNVKNTAPFVNAGEEAAYNRLTADNKKIFDNLPSNYREKIDKLYLSVNPTVEQINKYPVDVFNAVFFPPPPSQ